jgi:hypothetical protein
MRLRAATDNPRINTSATKQLLPSVNRGSVSPHPR